MQYNINVFIAHCFKSAKYKKKGEKHLIDRLIKKGEEDKKSITKTFRLRHTASEALSQISNYTEISQNETINTLIEETYETLKLLKKAKMFLEKKESVSVEFFKKFSEGNIIIFTVEHKEDKLICILSLAIDDIAKGFGGTEFTFIIEDVFQLAKYGVDSTYRYSEK